MGARLSQPRGPAGTTESSVPTKPAPPASPRNPFPRRINSRTIVAPAAALTMALLLFVYSRTSIRAAKANAQRHRDADTGGEGLSLLNEHRRRHGMREKVGKEGIVRELGRELVGGKKDDVQAKVQGGGDDGEEERRKLLRMKMGRKGGEGREG